MELEPSGKLKSTMRHHPRLSCSVNLNFCCKLTRHPHKSLPVPFFAAFLLLPSLDFACFLTLRSRRSSETKLGAT